MKMISFVLLAVALAAGSIASAGSSDVAYPEGYRAWHHIKSMVINEGHPLFEAVGGIHSIYANPQALDGYRSGKQFAEGSVIVFDLFEALDADNTVVEGDRKAVIVMEKGSKYGDTGNWGYQVFDPATGKGTLDAAAAAGCHGCHTQQQAEDFVFSSYRD